MSEEEKKELQGLCGYIKKRFKIYNRPFIIAVGGIPGEKDSTQAILVDGSMSQVEYLVIEILRVITEAGKENEKNASNLPDA